MDRKELLRYGNELTIIGFVTGNNIEHNIVFFPGEVTGRLENPKIIMIDPSMEEIHQIIRQMDVQEIEGLEKTVLRKSQRNIDTKVSWQVFRRDNFTCVYCGADDVPMTVDHIVLWEHMGDSVPDNLNCSCKKCNKTRGSIEYSEWVNSKYITDRVSPTQFAVANLHDLKMRGIEAEKLPLRKTKRSR